MNIISHIPEPILGSGAGLILGGAIARFGAYLISRVPAGGITIASAVAFSILTTTQYSKLDFGMKAAIIMSAYPIGLAVANLLGYRVHFF